MRVPRSRVRQSRDGRGALLFRRASRSDLPSFRPRDCVRAPWPSRPAETRRGNPQLAIAEPASNHPVVQGVGKVVTNHATGVRHPELSPVLKVRALGEPDILLAQAGAVGQGRFLALGDASVVINAMLRYPGNKGLARGLLRYATDDDTWGKRGGRVFIAIGDF